MSPGTATTSVCCASSRAASSRSAAPRAVHSSPSPRWAYARAISSPSPREAPVISAIVVVMPHSIAPGQRNEPRAADQSTTCLFGQLLQQAALGGERDGLRAILGAELVKDGVHVELHRAF